MVILVRLGIAVVRLGIAAAVGEGSQKGTKVREHIRYPRKGYGKKSGHGGDL